MKNTNTCPKCGENDILLILGNINDYGVGSNIQVGIFVKSVVKVERYFCLNYGYIEEWVKKEDIPILKEKFKYK